MSSRRGEMEVLAVAAAAACLQAHDAPMGEKADFPMGARDFASARYSEHDSVSSVNTMSDRQIRLLLSGHAIAWWH